MILPNASLHVKVRPDGTGTVVRGAVAVCIAIAVCKVS